MLARRVAARYVLAKGLSLLPDFKEALGKLRNGDREPAQQFTAHLIEVILPGGNRPDWFAGLSTQKLNALRFLYREAQLMQGNFSSVTTDPEAWDRYLIFQMEKWAKPLRTLELASAVGDEESEIEHGQFSIIPIPGVTKAQLAAALSALDEAASKIRPKFPQLLYGKVFLSQHIKKGVAAHYEYASDSMTLNVKAKKRFSDVYTLIHELGHRHDGKFLLAANRKTYWDLSTRKVRESIKFDETLRRQMADEAVSLAKAKAQGRPLPSMSDLLVLWLKSPHPVGDVRSLTTKYLQHQITGEELHQALMGKADGEVMTEKILHGPIRVTEYGGKNPVENYAEGFAHFVLGMDMPPELAAIIASESK